MRFKQWYLAEQTASQFVKDSINSDKVKVLKPLVTRFLANRIHNHNEQVFSRYVNWFIKELIIQNTTSPEPALDDMWGNIGDYIVAHLNANQLQSRFNQKEFTYDQVVALSHQWHNSLNDPSKTRIGPEGKTVIEVGNGFKWVALDKGYCEKEGKAGGHCGNVGSQAYDNIYSLRDSQNRVHLTFISNLGVLGEMKGHGNTKPASKYHPAIIKLLLSDYIGSIKGGGYLPEKNFSLSDLTPEEQQFIRSQKPYIDDPEAFIAHREKLSRSFHSKGYSIDLATAKTDEEIKAAISNIVWQKPFNGEMPYDLNMKKGDVPPEIISRHEVWKGYIPLLNTVYTRARKTSADELFSWMDRAIKIFVSIVVETDKKTFSKIRDDKTSLFNNTPFSLIKSMSGFIKLSDATLALMQQQPEILDGAPSRSSFSSWNKYYAALTRYVGLQGYELPQWNPNNNHIISYEFSRKMAEEIKAQSNFLHDI